MLKFEHRREPLVPTHVFIRRLINSASIALVMVAVSLGIGILGYHAFAHLSWLDALLNASMILTGMGPVDPMKTAGAKLFASIFALYSGVAFLSSVGVLAAPVVHRLLHRFHLEADETSSEPKPRPTGH